MGMQLILVRTNGTVFPTGDSWKCITCGVPEGQKEGNQESFDYPQSFKDWRRVMVGRNVVDCDDALLASPECMPEKVRIYPIWWEGGPIRELRLHPDNFHLGFNSFTYQDGALGQYAYFGRLKFVSSPIIGSKELKTPRYELVNVTRLFDPNAAPPVEFHGDEMVINSDAITIGELRGFSGSGKEVNYIGYPAESCNWDIFAADLRTGKPWLVDQHGDRDSYFGQKINAAGDGNPGAINDPNWNARADPRWSPDGTQIMYHQTLVQAPACGGDNPLPCPVSTYPGGRMNRIMLATLTSRKPLPSQPVAAVPEFIPWGTPYTRDEPLPVRQVPPPGLYTLRGKASGTAKVEIIGNETSISQIAVNYTNFSNDGLNTLGGTENVSVTHLSVSASRADWNLDLTSTGEFESTKETGPGGFQLEIDAMVNICNATGSMTTTIHGVAYKQPTNGT